MNENKKFIIRCRAIIMHEGRLLVVKHPHDTSFAALPGGHLEFGEDVLGCVSREVEEELGVRPEIGRLLYVNTFIVDGLDTQPIEFFFEVTNGKDYLNSDKLVRSHAHEIAEIIWASPSDNIRILPQQLGQDLKEGKILSDALRYINGVKK